VIGNSMSTGSWKNRLPKRAFSPVLTKEVQQTMSVDYWPDVRMRAFHALNLPMSILLSWYSHPLSIQTNSVLGSSFLRVCERLSVKTRVVTLDAVLSFGVSLQWWLVGLWLERPVPLARVLRIIAAGMALLGIAVTLTAIPRLVSEIVAIQHVVEVLSLVIALGVGVLDYDRNRFRGADAHAGTQESFLSGETRP